VDPLTESLTLQSHLPTDFLVDALRADVTRGLTATPKSLPPKWFYDERGSVLFEEITRLPEYYPTRAEREILLARAPEIAATTGARTLVELGSGSGEKTRLLIEALRAHGTLAAYVPMDVSEVQLHRRRGSMTHLLLAPDHLEPRGVLLDEHAAELPPPIPV